ncbi:MAG: hypothetical protein LUD78_06425 [Clostridiales bacterium]|nr:hypothetical protein [Clostridiales bacterium]
MSKLQFICNDHAPFRAKRTQRKIRLPRKYRISREDRTLTVLSRLDARVYVHCGDRKTRRKFIEDAENEYFHYGDGVSLLEREPEDIMALNSDRTVNFVGYIGHMAYRNAKTVSTKRGVRPLLRVDYRKYAAGYENYLDTL